MQTECKKLQFIIIISFENFKWMLNKNFRNVGKALIIYFLEKTPLINIYLKSISFYCGFWTNTKLNSLFKILTDGLMLKKWLWGSAFKSSQVINFSQSLDWRWASMKPEWECKL